MEKFLGAQLLAMQADSTAATGTSSVQSGALASGVPRLRHANSTSAAVPMRKPSTVSRIVWSCSTTRDTAMASANATPATISTGRQRVSCPATITASAP